MRPIQFTILEEVDGLTPGLFEDHLVYQGLNVFEKKH